MFVRLWTPWTSLTPDTSVQEQKWPLNRCRRTSVWPSVGIGCGYNCGSVDLGIAFGLGARGLVPLLCHRGVLVWGLARLYASESAPLNFCAAARAASEMAIWVQPFSSAPPRRLWCSNPRQRKKSARQILHHLDCFRWFVFRLSVWMTV